MVRRINLLPQAERARTATDFGFLALLAVVVVAIFALAFGYYLLHNTLNDRRQELADVQQQAASVDAQVAALKQYDRLQAERVSTEAVVQKIYANRTLVSDALDALSLVVPETAWFQSLTLSTQDPPPIASGSSAAKPAATEKSDNALEISGNTYSFEEVAQVLVRLELVPSLSAVKLVSAGAPLGTTDPSKEVRGFSIDASVVNTQPADTQLPMSQVEVEGP